MQLSRFCVSSDVVHSIGNGSSREIDRRTIYANTNNNTNFRHVSCIRNWRFLGFNNFSFAVVTYVDSIEYRWSMTNICTLRSKSRFNIKQKKKKKYGQITVVGEKSVVYGQEFYFHLICTQ